MESPKILKQMTPTMCPHCNKEIFIGTQAMMPSVVSVSTMLQIKEVKKNIIERVEELKFSNDEEKKQVIDYLNNENTLLDNSDIESLIKQISVEQMQKLSEKKKDE